MLKKQILVDFFCAAFYIEFFLTFREFLSIAANVALTIGCAKKTLLNLNL